MSARIAVASGVFAVLAAGSVAAPTPAAAGTSSVTLNITTPRQVDRQLTLSGHASDVTVPTSVSVTRDDPSGTPSQTAGMTNDNGDYSITDTPTTRGAT